MRPYEDPTIPVEAWKVLDQFKKDINFELMRCKDVRDFNHQIITGITDHLYRIAEERFHEDDTRTDCCLLQGEYWHPQESDFMFFLQDMAHQITNDEIEILMMGCSTFTGDFKDHIRQHNEMMEGWRTSHEAAS